MRTLTHLFIGTLAFFFVIHTVAYAKDLNTLTTKAAQGDVEAQFNLGVHYYTGQGVPQDYTQAYKWWSLAAVADVAAAKNRDIVAKEMTAAEISMAQQLAREWRPKAAQ